MKILKGRRGDSKLELQIAPLIDVVFLLLIYFMVAATLIKKEGDIAFALPGPNTVSITEQPVEALIMVSDSGMVELDGVTFTPGDAMLNELVHQMMGLKEIASKQNVKFLVTISPNREAVHSRIIEVMDACAAAGVQSLAFGKST